jgi:hypothetical protein
MNTALAEDGFVIVGDFLGTGDLDTFQLLVDVAYGAVDDGDAPAAIIESVRGWGGIGMPSLSDLLGCPGATLAFVQSVIERSAEPIVGPCPLIPTICLFRRHVEIRTLMPWHIDADGAGTKSYDPCINIWLPLVSVGETRPSLEIIRGSHRVMRGEPELPASNASRSMEWVDERFPPESRSVAKLEPGDALIFDHYTIYRSQPMDYVESPCVSGEFRVTLDPRYLS